ncbi:MAG TPA: S9 family peptidase [Caulobacteraceae bacterium]|jgi:dipeptidyl aminopeptidase/acylaminoacyl peptidase
MRRGSGLAAVIAAAAFAVGAKAAPLAAYGNLPTLEQISLSPSGRLLAIDVVKGENRTIVVQDLVAKKIVTGVKVGDTKIRDLKWAGDDHLIITSSITQTGMLGVLVGQEEWFTAVDFNVAACKLHPLLTDVDYAGNMIGGEPIVRTVDGKATLFLRGMRFIGDEGQSTMFRVDLDTDHAQPIIDSGGDWETSFLMAANGKPLAETQYDAPLKSWILKVWAGGGWHQAQAKQASIETPDLVGLGRDGQSILIGNREGDRYTLRELSPDGATLSDPLPGIDAGQPITDPPTHRLIGLATLIGDDMRYRFFDPNDQTRWRAVTAAFPGKDVGLVSWSDDRRRIVVEVTGPKEAPAYALVDLDAGAVAWLGTGYPALGEGDVGEVRPVDFKAADGLEISGYLTLPSGKDAKQLPLIVFPHGGPAARDEPGFDWWAQAMASKGYAVLQVNYRGSEGFGWKFMSAGFGEWGRKMQTDLSDGVRYLAAQGTIDPKRVCIVGASYGGYAALAGAAIDTGVYRCSVDISGPAELAKFINWGKDREGFREGVGTERYWSRFMGAANSADPHLAEISPADHADKVTIPVLIIHGKDDTVVPFEQSQIMADALTKAGKNVQLVVLAHEDHWLSHSDTRLQMLQATMDFVQKNNPAE